nr:MAG TPA: hypothetical protein [Caudoviricetes sp.]
MPPLRPRRPERRRRRSERRNDYGGPGPLPGRHGRHRIQPARAPLVVLER